MMFSFVTSLGYRGKKSITVLRMKMIVWGARDSKGKKQNKMKYGATRIHDAQ